MHPDYIPLGLAKGQLFLKMPDGSETQLKYETAQITPKEEPQTYADECRYIVPAPPLPEISIEMAPCPEFDAWQQAMVSQSLIQMLQKVNKFAQDMVCWAMEMHPEWCRIMRRTKKGRTRKKYSKRILQAYLEEVARRD
jgi:hypothetical protein